MEAADQSDATPQARARRIVNFWRRRGWLSNSAPIHLHRLDLDKLEELIAAELEKGP